MLCISMNLTGEEWPEEQLSRAEICRRFALAGVQVLPKMSAADQALILQRFRMTQLAPESERLRH
jgi:hypothetical protein